MSEPEHIREILPKVIEVIKERCNKMKTGTEDESSIEKKELKDES